MHLGKPMWAGYCLSEVSIVAFETFLMLVRLKVALSPSFKDDRWVLDSSLLQATEGVISFVLAGGVSSSSTFQISWDTGRLWWLLCLPVLTAQSGPLSPACPGQCIHRSFWRWMSNIVTCQSGLPISLFTFWSLLIEPVRTMACVVWLSPLKTVQLVQQANQPLCLLAHAPDFFGPENSSMFFC